MDEKVEAFFEALSSTKLEHHGIKGMKWGVRRASSSGGSGVGTTKASSAKSPVVVKSQSSTSHKTLSDAELRERINRLQMEKTYKQLMAEQNPKKVTAKKIIGEILQNAAKQSATQLLTTVATSAGKQFVGTAFKKSNPDLSKSIWNPKASEAAESAKKLLEDVANSEK